MFRDPLTWFKWEMPPTHFCKRVYRPGPVLFGSASSLFDLTKLSKTSSLVLASSLFDLTKLSKASSLCVGIIAVWLDQTVKDFIRLCWHHRCLTWPNCQILHPLVSASSLFDLIKLHPLVSASSLFDLIKLHPSVSASSLFDLTKLSKTLSVYVGIIAVWLDQTVKYFIPLYRHHRCLTWPNCQRLHPFVSASSLFDLTKLSNTSSPCIGIIAVWLDQTVKDFIRLCRHHRCLTWPNCQRLHPCVSASTLFDLTKLSTTSSVCVGIIAVWLDQTVKDFIPLFDLTKLSKTIRLCWHHCCLTWPNCQRLHPSVSASSLFDLTGKEYRKVHRCLVPLLKFLQCFCYCSRILRAQQYPQFVAWSPNVLYHHSGSNLNFNHVNKWFTCTIILNSGVVCILESFFYLLPW